LKSKAEIKVAIESAFAGVRLDGGLSLNQTKVVDNYGRGVSSEQFSKLPNQEVTDDWTAIPPSVLDDADSLGHLDAEGFRYYIPALMLRLLDSYDSCSMMTIGTLGMLYPKREGHEYLYSHLNEPQFKAIACYLEALPELINLEGEDRTVVERAFRKYWSKYLYS